VDDLVDRSQGLLLYDLHRPVTLGRCSAPASVCHLDNPQNFPGSSRSLQVACLAGVREADVVILLLGERYGPKQNLGLSATHEEYREAKERCTVIPFVQGNITFDDDQDAFAAEVRSWNGGHYSASFDGPEDLRR
jgi:hypothetical protein